MVKGMNQEFLLRFLFFLKSNGNGSFEFRSAQAAINLGVSNTKATCLIGNLIDSGWLVRQVFRDGEKRRPRYAYSWKQGADAYFQNTFYKLYSVEENGNFIWKLLREVSSKERYFSKNELLVLIELIRKSQPLGYVFGVSLTDLSENAGLAVNTIRKAIDGLAKHGAIKIIKCPNKASIFKRTTNLYAFNFDHHCFARFRSHIVDYILIDGAIDYQNEAAEYVLLYRKVKRFKGLVAQAQLTSKKREKKSVLLQRTILIDNFFTRLSLSSRPLYKLKLRDRIWSLQSEVLELTSVDMKMKDVSDIFDISDSGRYVQATLHVYASIMLTCFWDNLNELSTMEYMIKLISQDISIDRLRLKIRKKADEKIKFLLPQVIQQVAYLTKSVALRVKSFIDGAALHHPGRSYYIHPLEDLRSYNLNLKVTSTHSSNTQLSGVFHIKRVELDKYDVLI